MESFEKLSTFVDLFHYLYYKTREGRKLDVPQLLGLYNPIYVKSLHTIFKSQKKKICKAIMLRNWIRKVP